MNKRPLRKLAGLIVLYVLIFFVIIVIQFKNETIINESFGPFHIILSETKNEDNIPVLKNNFQITAGELTFFADSNSPARIIIGENEQNLTLNTWRKKSNSDFLLFFDNGIYVEFEAPEEQAVPLLVRADMPSSVDSIIIPFKLSTTADIETVDSSSLLLTGREQLYKISAAKIDGDYISMTKSSPLFSIDEYVEETRFTFDTLTEYELAQIPAYNTSKNIIQKSLIELFPAKPDEATFSEKTAVAWVAEMALQGKYQQAVNTLSSYAKSSSRSYISTPYFNTLVASNKTLTQNLATLDTEIKNSLANQDMSIFSNDNFIEKSIIIQRDTLQSLLTAAKNTIENQPDTITAKTAASILTAFNKLKKYNIKEAELIEPYLETLAGILETYASLDENGDLVIMNGTKPLDFMERIKAGFALLETGNYKGNFVYQSAGRLLINSTIQQAEQLTLDTLAELYPLFVPDNHFYPHIELLDVTDNNPVWAWTIAESMNYTKGTDGSVLIKATFTQNEVHHMIIRGIKKFSAIDIYGIAYRTDPRFESYNSSGYVFENDTESLLLKYRQRSYTEDIKLYYK